MAHHTVILANAGIQNIQPNTELAGGKIKAPLP